MILPLSQLLQGIGLSMALPADPLIHHVAIDSRKVRPGTLFLALQGAKEDGFRFAAQAVSSGAVAILYEGEERPEASGLSIPALAILSLRPFAAPLLHRMHGEPGKRLFKVGITGTNGKTTLTRLAAALLAAAGHKVIRLGTIDYAFGDTVLPSSLTTPGSDTLFEMLEKGLDQGCNALAMEVSSHALSLDRARGLLFQRAIFTNLTQDHLDFHADFEEYFAAKSRLFSRAYLAEDGLALVNLDSPYGRRLHADLSQKRLPAFAFSRNNPDADLTLVSADLTLSGSVLVARHGGRNYRVASPLVGAINVENLLAAIALGLSLGLGEAAMAQALAPVSVSGRNEVLPLPRGAFAVVDYAHTPDALERVLASLRPLTSGRLHCVFGCGGDRDKGKRPVMGAIAERLADSILVTSDNPRSENAEAIMRDILAGMSGREKVRVIADRREAIATALASAAPGDCVVIAGKGHEDYQIVGANRLYFSDQGEVKAFISSRPGEG